MLFDKTKVKNILVISLSNIGDVILTFPVMDILRNDFPQAKISVVVGPKAQSLFENNPYFSRVFIYNKHQSVAGKIRFVLELQRQQFDCMIDLRNTAIPFFVPTRYRTPLRKTSADGLHMKEKHLKRLKSVYSFDHFSDKQYCLFINGQDKKHIKDILDDKIQQQPFILIAPGAADPSKRWDQGYFARLADELVRKGVKIVFIGSKEDDLVARSIGELMKNPFINLCGHTTLLQLAELMKYAKVVITNDSAPMHLASYLNRPVLALFGPTSPIQYGPWSERNIFVSKKDDCAVCKNPKLKKTHDCIQTISVESVLTALKYFEDIF